MKTSASKWLAVLAVVVAAPLQAEWRTFAGGFSSRWLTVGPHGHDQPPCAGVRRTEFLEGRVILDESPNCNPSDFARGNLDNSIGFRTGRERDFGKAGPLRLVGGVEGSVSYTEYNLTQVDFALMSGAITAGVDLELGSVRVGGRLGAGPFGTTDGQELGLGGFREISVTVPLRPGAGLRISQRNTSSLKRHTTITTYGSGAGGPDPLEDHAGSPSAIETSVLLVASPEFSGNSRWDFASTTGSTSPGKGLGGDRMLRPTTFTRFSVFRDVSWHDVQLEVAWNTSAHESKLPTMFFGYNGNYRSKTVDGFGVSAWRSLPVTDRLAVRYGGGLEVADWRDEHHLLTRDGRELRTGVETALTGSLGARYQLVPHVALESTLQKVYWQGIDLSEMRWSFGIALTR